MSEIICDLCPHYCKLNLNQIGFCGARKNIDNKITPLNYGSIASIALDPIEKKPLAYYKPGSNIISVGSFGCNMNCPFCQNHTLARTCSDEVKGYKLSSEELIEIAKREKANGNIGIAFTYNEPLINYEYILDTAKLAKKEDLDIVIVTNGQINDFYLEELLVYVDAWNIDLKSFSKDIYNKMGGNLNTTLNTIKKASKKSHVEITTLIVPGISDDLKLFEEELKFLSELDKNIPLHISRYFPQYKYNKPSLTINEMLEFKKLADKYLKRVNMANM